MKSNATKFAALAGSFFLAGTLAACSDSGKDAAAEDKTLIVFAAASLKPTFTQLAEDFEDEHDNVDVKLSFGGSSDLAAQINEGAPADVFASADERTMALVTDAGGASGTPKIFVANTLQIATPPDNPAQIKTIEDLSDPDTKVVLCAPQVPCGAASTKLLDLVSVKVKPVSEELSVTDVLGKVSSGEADAGLVYVTDVVSAGDSVRGIVIPEASKVVNSNPIVALKEASDPELAQAFVDLIHSDDAREVFEEAGFGAP